MSDLYRLYFFIDRFLSGDCVLSGRLCVVSYLTELDAIFMLERMDLMELFNAYVDRRSDPPAGTLVPNRVFVGGISANTTEVELAQLFSAYGTVKATKIISDRAGVSKGYGFVTFESEEEAKRLQREVSYEITWIWFAQPKVGFISFNLLTN